MIPKEAQDNALTASCYVINVVLGTKIRSAMIFGNVREVKAARKFGG